LSSSLFFLSILAYLSLARICICSSTLLPYQLTPSRWTFPFHRSPFPLPACGCGCSPDNSVIGTCLQSSVLRRRRSSGVRFFALWHSACEKTESISLCSISPEFDSQHPACTELLCHKAPIPPPRKSESFELTSTRPALGVSSARWSMIPFRVAPFTLSLYFRSELYPPLWYRSEYFLCVLTVSPIFSRTGRPRRDRCVPGSNWPYLRLPFGSASMLPGDFRTICHLAPCCLGRYTSDTRSVVNFSLLPLAHVSTGTWPPAHSVLHIYILFPALILLFTHYITVPCFSRRRDMLYVAQTDAIRRLHLYNVFELSFSSILQLSYGSWSLPNPGVAHFSK